MKGEEAQTALRVGRSPLEWILAKGKAPPVLPTFENYPRYVEGLNDSRMLLKDFFRLLLILRQPGSRRSIHDWKPSKESLRQINVVPDLSYCSRSSCCHRVPGDQGAVHASGPFERDGASG